MNPINLVFQVSLYVFKCLVLEFRFSQVNVYWPTRVIECSNPDSERVLPVSIAVRRIPSLKPLKLIHKVTK